MRRIGLIICIGSVLVLACQASFATLVFSMDVQDPENTNYRMAASAQFSWDSGHLYLDLTNLSYIKDHGQASPTLQQNDLLAAFFFNIPQGVLVRPTTPDPLGSDVQFTDFVDHWGTAKTSDVVQYNGDVSWSSFTYPIGAAVQRPSIASEWGWADNLSLRDGPGRLHLNAGVSAMGLAQRDGTAAFPNEAKFHTGNISGRVPIAGPDWTLLGEHNGAIPAIQNNSPYVQSAAQFTWALQPGILFSPSSIDTGWFQFGTTVGYEGDLGFPVVGGPGPAVPEPASCALLALAIGGVGAALKRRRK